MTDGRVHGTMKKRGRCIMTRGKIIYIDKDCKVYSTVEFNGDMYPDGNADDILDKFESGFL